MNLKNEKVTWQIMSLTIAAVFAVVLRSQDGIVVGEVNSLQLAKAFGSFATFIILSLFVFVPFYLKKSNYSNLAFCVALISFTTMSVLGQNGYSITDLGRLNSHNGYNDCILDNSASLSTSVAVIEVRKACRSKYPLRLRTITSAEISALSGKLTIHKRVKTTGLINFNAEMYRFEEGSLNILISNPTPHLFVKQFVIGVVDPKNSNNYQEIKVEIPERDSGAEYSFNINTHFTFDQSKDIDWFIKSALVYSM
ncbi:hypothetical protein [Shewanella gaetbuli]